MEHAVEVFIAGAFSRLGKTHRKNEKGFDIFGHVPTTGSYCRVVRGESHSPSEMSKERSKSSCVWLTVGTTTQLMVCSGENMRLWVQETEMTDDQFRPCPVICGLFSG